MTNEDIEIHIENVDVTNSSKDNPVTRDEALSYIIKKIDTDVFTYRNLSGRKTQDEIARFREIEQYIKENLN